MRNNQMIGIFFFTSFFSLCYHPLNPIPVPCNPHSREKIAAIYLHSACSLPDSFIPVNFCRNFEG